MTELTDTPRFTCRSCGDSYMLLALDAAGEFRALAGWRCPKCTHLTPAPAPVEAAPTRVLADGAAPKAAVLLGVFCLAVALIGAAALWLGVAS